MKVLQICHRVPFPPIDGGNIVMMNMALALYKSGIEVHQFALNTNKHFTETEKIPETIRRGLNFRSVGINTSVTAGGFIKSIFSRGSYNTSRFYDKHAEEEISSVLRSGHIDIVQLETLFAAPYIDCIRKNSTAKIVLRAHNVEHVIWERMAASEKNPVRKVLLRYLSSRLKSYELRVLKQIDALVPITIVDENMFRRFGFEKPVLTLPMSMDISEYSYNENDRAQLCLFHLGSMDWMPNLEAVEWFLRECWPLIHKQHPQLKLFLAGRSFPRHIMDAKYQGVICEGKIEDAHAFMSDKQIMIVPLHSGSGMRVKIIQGMAHGKTIISTTIGAEGIPVEDGKNILIADSANAFATAVSRCIADEKFCREIGHEARKFAEENFSNETIGTKLKTFYTKLLP